MNSEFDLELIFNPHPLTNAQVVQCCRIREAAKVFAQAILDNSPGCLDQFEAIQKTREAVMVASTAIALKGRLYK